MVEVTTPTHLRRIARNRVIMVNVTPRNLLRELIHVPTTIRGGLMMLDVARENNGRLMAAQYPDALFLYLRIPNDP